MGTIGAIIAWAFAGLIVGAIARFLVPGRQEMGLLMTMVMGIVGAILGGLVSYAISGQQAPLEYWPGYLLAILGAVVVVWAYSSMGRRHQTLK